MPGLIGKAVALVFTVIFFCPGFSFANDTGYITVSGEVKYKDFKKGVIEVFWAGSLELGMADSHGLQYMLEPGEFALRIPKNQGQVYICATNRPTNNSHKSLAYFISDPVFIGEKDIAGYVISLKTNKLLMAEYRGRKITVSGRVECARCEEGKINVCAYSPDWFRKNRLPPDINKTVLSSPGDFRLELPENAGEVYIMAVNVPKEARSGNCKGCARVNFSGNPLDVKDKDIAGLVLTIN